GEILVAYVNEYASDEDIEKYKLNEVWDRYHPHGKDDRFWGRKPELTIDHDRDVFMMVVSRGKVSGGTQFKFLFSIRGEEFFVYLNLVKGSSPKLTDTPFYRVWDFVKIKRSEGCKIHESEIVQEVKKVVSAFGYNGVRRQIPETIVKFNF
ncbi:MAG: hypothetical protein WBM58_20745, partial [Sedimenticolaceae bacterium]